MKVLKDADSSLVSNENFSEILQSMAVGPRSGTSSQKWPKTYLTYDITHKKTKPKTNFFYCRLEDLL